MTELIGNSQSVILVVDVKLQVSTQQNLLVEVMDRKWPFDLAGR